MRIPGLGNLTRKAAQKKAFKMLKHAGIKKSKRILQAEYEDYCDRSKPKTRDKIGFLSVMNWLGDQEAKEWIDQERTRLDAIVEQEEQDKEQEAGK